MEFKKINLYLKEVPGLKYLGITTQNPYTYKGSGKYWTNHLKAHNFKAKDIKTTILSICDNREQAKILGLQFSEYYNVVKSEEFANLIPENGGLYTEYKLSLESRLKLSNSLKESYKNGIKISHTKGKKLSEETKNKIRFSNLGKKMSEESKLKLKNTKLIQYKNNLIIPGMLGKTHTIENKNKQSKRQLKTIYQYSLDNIFIEKWEGAKIIEDKLNIKAKRISDCCRGIKKTYKGFIWSFVKFQEINGQFLAK